MFRDIVETKIAMLKNLMIFGGLVGTKGRNFPEIKMAFYVSKRTNYVHTGLGSPLFSCSRHSQMTDTIQSFMPDELDERFPQLLSTVKWKYDYIFFLKKLKKFIF